MGDVLIKVAAFVAIIAAGYFAGHTGRLGRGTGTTLSKIVFNLTLPCAVVNAFGQADFSGDILWLVVVGVAFTVGSYAVTFALVRRSDPQARIFYLCNVCGYNIGCFALPFVQAFFPATQAVAACLFDAGNAFMMAGGTYALTSVLASDEAPEHPVRLALRRLLSSAAVDTYAVLVAMALLGLRFPDAVIGFTQPMANANAFLAMFMLGLMMNLDVDRARLARAGRLLAARGAFNVAFTLLALFVLPLARSVRIVLAMLIWAPMGSMGPVFTLWCGGDHGLAGFVNAVTIAVAIVVMTAIVVTTGAVA